MKRFSVLWLGILFLSGTPAWGWWAGGHGILSRAAALALPEEVPAFFRGGGGMIAHCAYDPDVSKNRATPLVRGAEHPEHYLDLELLEGRELPGSRYEYIELCEEIGVRPEKAGFVPYAVAEYTERLAVAFAEHRKWPESPYIQNKCLVYAGFLSHYAQDMCQPLHLTIHFNGRVEADGSSERSRIHENVDSLVEYFKMDAAKLAQEQELTPLTEDLMGGVLAEFMANFQLVDRVYELEAALPSYQQEDWVRSEDVVEFANERARESVRFTASLYLTAWRLSEKVKLDGWLDRAKSDGRTASK